MSSASLLVTALPHFSDTEEVRGSNPLAPTSNKPGESERPLGTRLTPSRPGSTVKLRLPAEERRP